MTAFEANLWHGRRISVHLFCLYHISCISDEAKYIKSFSVILSLYIIALLPFISSVHSPSCLVAAYISSQYLEGSSRYSRPCLGLSSHAMGLSGSMLAAEILLSTSCLSFNIWCATCSIVWLRDTITLTTIESAYANLSAEAAAGSIDVHVCTCVLHSLGIPKLQRGPNPVPWSPL